MFFFVETLVAAGFYGLGAILAGQEHMRTLQHIGAAIAHGIVGMFFGMLLGTAGQALAGGNLFAGVIVKFFFDFVIGCIVGLLAYSIEFRNSWKVGLTVAIYFMLSFFFWRWAVT